MPTNRSDIINFGLYLGSTLIQRKKPCITVEAIRQELGRLREAQNNRYAWYRCKRIRELSKRLQRIINKKQTNK